MVFYMSFVISFTMHSMKNFTTMITTILSFQMQGKFGKGRSLVITHWTNMKRILWRFNMFYIYPYYCIYYIVLIINNNILYIIRICNDNIFFLRNWKIVMWNIWDFLSEFLSIFSSEYTVFCCFCSYYRSIFSSDEFSKMKSLSLLLNS